MDGACILTLRSQIHCLRSCTREAIQERLPSPAYAAPLRKPDCSARACQGANTRAAQSGMDRYLLARLMGHSSPRITERYYIHVTDSHVASGFDTFVAYQAEQMLKAFPKETDAVQ